MKRVNPFTALRLLLIPALWLLALARLDAWLGVGIAAAAATDVLDGMLARRDARYKDGASDSLADKALTASVVMWLALLRPQIFRENAWLVLAAAVLYAAALLAGWLKFRRVLGLHTHLGKLGGLSQAIFVVHAFAAGGYHPGLLAVALGLWIAASVEELAIVLTHPVVDEESVRSIVPYLRARLGRP